MFLGGMPHASPDHLGAARHARALNFNTHDTFKRMPVSTPAQGVRQLSETNGKRECGEDDER